MLSRMRDSLIRDNKAIPWVLGILVLLVSFWIVAGFFLGGQDEEPVSNRAFASQSQELAQQSGAPAAPSPELENRNAESYAAYQSKDPFRELIPSAEEAAASAPLAADDGTTDGGTTDDGTTDGGTTDGGTSSSASPSPAGGNGGDGGGTSPSASPSSSASPSPVGDDGTGRNGGGQGGGGRPGGGGTGGGRGDGTGGGGQGGNGNLFDSGGSLPY